MDNSSSEESDISDSEIHEYVEKPYEELRSRKLVVKTATGILRCPFCAGKKKQDYKYKDLLQHALGVSKGAAHRSGKQKVNHLALAKYLQNDLIAEADQTQNPVGPTLVPQKSEQKELYVWPWMGIVVHMVADQKDVITDPGDWLERFAKYKPVKVHTFWNPKDSIVQAVVEFDGAWSGFMNATDFENFFETQQQSKKDWRARKTPPSSNIFGWCARDDDYNSEDQIGEFLRGKGKLSTISDIVKEKTQSRTEAVENLTNEIEKKNMNLDELRYKYNEKNMTLSRMLAEKDQLHQAFNEGCSYLFKCLCD